jgi:hypothetical protein
MDPAEELRFPEPLHNNNILHFQTEFLPESLLLALNSGSLAELTLFDLSAALNRVINDTHIHTLQVPYEHWRNRRQLVRLVTFVAGRSKSVLIGQIRGP